MNPIFNALNGNNMMAQFEQFKKTFSGDPKAEVQKLLDSGRMSQQQYEELARRASLFMQFFK